MRIQQEIIKGLELGYNAEV